MTRCTTVIPRTKAGSINSLGAKTKTVYVERCATLLGEWEHVPSDSLNNNQWVEGPTIFQFNSQDTDGSSKWCLLVDDFGGGGYYPLVSDDLSSGDSQDRTAIRCQAVQDMVHQSL